MNRVLRLVVLPALVAAVTLPAAPALAQFQSCIFCDVQPLNPDPFPVNRCQTGTSIINGIGYRTPSVNGCSVIPTDEVRSTRPDRVTILSFTVLSDTRISFDWMVPCNASTGLTGIDVTIDDDPRDNVIPYACGNLRMRVDPACGDGTTDPGELCDDGNTNNGDGCSDQCTIETTTLSVEWDTYRAEMAAGGVRVTWRTLSEQDTVGFEVWGRDAVNDLVVRQQVEARGAGVGYVFLDPSLSARQRSIREYRIVEFTSNGPGDATPWFPVSSVVSGASRGRGRVGSSGGSGDRP
jgi:cysteine-rich repeat protein